MVTTRRVVGAALVCIAWLVIRPVYAHHSFAAEFDASKTVTVRGTLVKVDWMNPHAWFHVAVKNGDGNVEEWMFEAGNPNQLTRRGFNKNSIPIGSQVVMEGYLSRGVPRRANGRVMKFADGRNFFLSSDDGSVKQ